MATEEKNELFCSREVMKHKLEAYLSDYSLFHSKGARFVRASCKQDRDQPANIIISIVADVPSWTVKKIDWQN